MARQQVDRDDLVKTFHSWVQSRKEFASTYQTFDAEVKKMIGDIFRTMPNLNHFTFQGHYYQKKTGWAKLTPRDQRTQMLHMGFRFLAELGRKRVEIGKEYPPYQEKKAATG